MKKILFLFLFLFTGIAFAQEDILPLENKKFTILKTTHNYSPVRENPDVNSRRAAHLKKGATLYSVETLKDFYRLDLGLDKYYFIEKKYADVDSIADEKKPVQISDIELVDESGYYGVKIKTPLLTAYNEIETSSNSLDFILYDSVIDKENLKVAGKNTAGFTISKDEFENLKISYYSNYPLTGHEVIKLDEGVLLKVKKPFKTGYKKPFKNLIFAIDPGHGGEDSGACANGLREKDINLQISKILAKELKKYGARVYMTRSEDVNPDLYERVDFAKEAGADFLFSIHQNSLANPENVYKKHGVGVYYYNKEAYELSKQILNALVENTGFRDDGVNMASFALTRAPNPVCVLIECGYIIHPDEAKLISNEKFQKKISSAIAKGVKNYLYENF